MYILTKEINKEEYIFYLMDDTNNPLRAKIEKANSKNIVNLSKKFAKEYNLKFCGKEECCNIKINTSEIRQDYGN